MTKPPTKKTAPKDKKPKAPAPDVVAVPPKPTDTFTTTNTTADPKALTLLEKNAHFMSERVFKQLVDNITRDGCLTSAPLVAVREGKKIVISGNHRVKASLAAGLTSIPIIEIAGDLSDSRMVGLQLSHNALNGEDDPNVLRELYDGLEMLEQRYSGLTDEDLGVLEDPDLVKLGVGLPAYEDIMVAFLPEDLTEFQDNIVKLKAKAERHPVFWAKFRDYRAFFEGIFAVKEAEKIGNDGVALLVMSQLALAHIKSLEVTEAEADENP
jgi:hypothetical protein